MRYRPFFARPALARWLMIFALSMGVLAGLGACAGARGSTGPKNDLVTASDETPDARRARIRYELAAGYYQEGKDEVALDDIKEVVRLAPSSVDGWILRGLIYMRMGHPDLAEESFRHAQSLQPDNGTVAHNYGWLLCQQKRYAEAEAQFKKAISVGYREASRTYMNMGVCEMEAGQKSAAEESFRQSLGLEPLNPISGYNLALLLYRRGQYDQARFYVRRLNNSDLANAQTLWLGIRVEHALQSTVAQQQLAAQLHSRFPDSPEAGLLDRGAFNE